MKWIFIMTLIATGCVFNETKPTYLVSDNGLSTVTILQYHKIGEPENAGIYITEGRHSEGQPKVNYVFINYTDFGLYFMWEGDRLLIRPPGFKIIKDKLLSNERIDFRIDFTESEKKKYGYYSNREEFYSRVKSDFKLITRKDLSKVWW